MLDLGTEEAAKVVSPETLFPYAHLTHVLFITYFVLGICLLAFFLLKKKKSWNPPVLLQNFPFNAKVAISLGLLAYTFVHVFAIWEVYLMTKVSFKSTSEYFFYMKLPKLVATTHAHLFGHGTMYLITSLIFIFSKLKESWKLIFICLAMSAGLLDVPSWWAIKYAGDQYEFFSAISGMMSFVGWGGMALRIGYEFWWSEFFGSDV